MSIIKQAVEQAAKNERLHLGAGNRVKKGWVNHDLTAHRPEIEVVHNLNVLPWPFKDETFKIIVALNLFEHLDIDLVTSLDECWRILQPGGVLEVKVPNSDDIVRCWDDPTHRRPYSFASFNPVDIKQADNERYNFYTDRKWQIEEKGYAGQQRSDGAWYDGVWTSIKVTLMKPKGGGKK